MGTTGGNLIKLENERACINSKLPFGMSCEQGLLYVRMQGKSCTAKFSNAYPVNIMQVCCIEACRDMCKDEEACRATTTTTSTAKAMLDAPGPVDATDGTVWEPVPEPTPIP